MPFSNEHIPEKVNLLAFTAYWCGPCKKQIPILKRFQEEFGQDKFNVIYINLDADKSKWEKMVQDYQLSTFINLTDTVNMEQSIMAKRFFINAVPTNILIDQNQKILYNSSQLGDSDLVLIRSYLKKAIDEIPISYDIPNNK